MENQCCPKKISELCDLNFLIPSYQRGYRWSTQQVNDLLNDIWEFSKTKREEEEFYCLQPIIVKKEHDSLWEVIDGQQRLTTIHIILTRLNSMLPEKEKQFTIEYATRKGSKEYLDSINIEKRDDNIDYFHMFNAYENINIWMDYIQKEENVSKNTLVMKLLPVFLENVKVIWYEIDPMVNSSEVFTRVNMGKIPLSNAELIKALFLKKTNFENDTEILRLRQLEIAGEWDRIEYSLQGESFWYYLTNNKEEYANRIDYIFKLMADDKNKKYNIKIIEKDLLSFHVFSKWFLEYDVKEAIDAIWKEVKDYFLKFEEWYQDKEIYHFTGFLITINIPITELKFAAVGKTKNEFKLYLKTKIRHEINFKIRKPDYSCEDLSYSDEKDKFYIRKILLLFNVITLNLNGDSNSRFPFQSYKKEHWDLEHIHAVKALVSERENEREDWINENIKDVSDNELYKLIDEVVSNKKVQEYDIIVDKMLNYFDENKMHEDIDNISNLAMLDDATNRAYKNAVFSIKRKTILKKDQCGIFIPQCTKNVFLKYYNDDVGQMSYWGKRDRENYIENIKNVLKDYLPKENK